MREVGGGRQGWRMLLEGCGGNEGNGLLGLQEAVIISLFADGQLLTAGCARNSNSRRAATRSCNMQIRAEQAEEARGGCERRPTAGYGRMNELL
jgi:hypothetical protein